MNLDLVTNGASIKASVKSLIDEKISWIVLGYSSNNTLNVIETGNDSFEDMFEEFDANKIMYGFAAVTDPNSKLKKNVFIYWQGEAASQSMKSISVQHSNIIRDLCKPVHVTHNARDEQDLDLKEIMTKVASASGSNYSYHNETKQDFQHVPSVKSEENSASNLRQSRLKELSALGSIQKEAVPEQKVGSTYEKVDAMQEIKNLRSTKFEGTNPPKPKVNNVIKDIKPAYVPFREQSGSNYSKINASMEIKSSASSLPVQKNMSSSYKRINPEEELKSLNLKQKSTFEAKTKVQSQNNTAQRAKEERQMELSNIFNKKILCDDISDHKVGTNYTKVNPMAEINKLRSESITSEDDVFHNTPSYYKKIDPTVEIQNLRRMSSSDSAEHVSPGTNYKKINPAEDIKKLRSQSTFSDAQSSNHEYKKINPTEEINNARKLSTPFINNKNANINEDVNLQTKRTSILSARHTFENAHKTNNDANQLHKFQLSKQDAFQESPKIKSNTSTIDTKKTENVRVPQLIQQNPKVIDNIKTAPFIKKEIIQDNKHLKNTAEAQFTYTATDTDEISFEEGEIIREIEVIDQDWWIGVNAAGQKGMFPSSYVMINNNESSKNEDHHVNIPEPQMEKLNTITDVKTPFINKEQHIETNDSLSATAIFDYQANDCDEISFDVGEILKEIEQVDDGWWIGVNSSGKKGMFPSNFVELNAKKEIDKKSSMIVEESNPSPRISSKDGLLSVHAIFDYNGNDDDELSFNTGDVIYNVSIVDEGWWEGELGDGKKGLFPSNYVETD